jgi:hypothetical protein
MNAAGHTLTAAELLSEIDFRVALTMPVYVASDDDLYPVERIDVDGGGIVLYCDNDRMNLAERVTELEEVLQSIADSDQTGSKMTKTQVIAAARAAL